MSLFRLFVYFTNFIGSKLIGSQDRPTDRHSQNCVLVRTALTKKREENMTKKVDTCAIVARKRYRSTNRLTNATDGHSILLILLDNVLSCMLITGMKMDRRMNALPTDRPTIQPTDGYSPYRCAFTHLKTRENIGQFSANLELAASGQGQLWHSMGSH